MDPELFLFQLPGPSRLPWARLAALLGVPMLLGAAAYFILN